MADALDPTASPAGAPVPEQTVKMVDGSGEPYTIPLASLQQAQSAGLRMATAEDEQRVAEKAKFGDRPLAAFGLGALAEGTAGLGPELLTASGLASPETQRGLAAHNEGAFGVGKGTALAVSALASGGESAAAEGADALAAGAAGRGYRAFLQQAADAMPVSGIGKLGEVVQRQVSEGVGGGLTGRVLGGVARGATEAPLYAAGDELTEDAFGNKPLTAESLLASVGPSVAIGAGLGGSFEAALGIGERYLPRALEKASGALERLEAKVQPADWAATERGLRTDLEKVHSGADEVLEGLHAEDKPRLVRQMLGDMDATGPAVAPLVADVRSQLDAVPFTSKGLKEAGRVVDSVEKRLSEAANDADRFLAIDQGHAQLDRLLKSDKALTAEQHAALEPLRDAVGGWGKALQSEAAWGKAGRYQADLAGHLDAYQESRAALEGALFSRSKPGAAPHVDPEKLSAFLKAKAAGDPVADRTAELLSHFTSTTRDLFQHLEDSTFGELPSKAAKARSYRDFLGQFTGSVDKAAAVRPAAPTEHSFAGELVGHMLQHVPLLGGAVVLSRNREVLAAVAKRASEVTSQIAKGVKAVLGTEGAGARAGAASAGASSTIGALGEVKLTTAPARGETRHGALERHRQDLAQLTADPQALSQRLSAAAPSLARSVPTLAGLVQTGASRATAYLQAQVPKGPPPNPIPGGPAWKPSDAQVHQYERVVRAVESPLSILDATRAGALTHAQVDAVRTVYPQLHQAMVSEVLRQLPDVKGPLPYARQLQLSLLVGAPLTSSLKRLPQLQANVGLPPPAQPDAAAGAPQSSGPGGPERPRQASLGAGQRAATPLNSLALGGSR